MRKAAERKFATQKESCVQLKLEPYDDRTLF
jgi:hypothetical protein